MCCCRSSDGVQLQAQSLAVYNPTNRSDAVPLQALSPCSPLSRFHCHLELSCALVISKRRHGAGVSQLSLPVRPGKSSLPALVPSVTGSRAGEPKQKPLSPLCTRPRV